MTEQNEPLKPCIGKNVSLPFGSARPFQWWAHRWSGSHSSGFLTEKTAQPPSLAVGSIMSMLPSIIIGPLAGAFVDRWSRKAVPESFPMVSPPCSLSCWPTCL